MTTLYHRSNNIKRSIGDPKNHSLGDGAKRSEKRQPAIPTRAMCSHPEGPIYVGGKPVFTALAEYGGAHGPFNTDKTLVYNKVVTNIGNAYNESTGVFVAPVAGVYYFTFFYHAGGHHETQLKLFKNSDFIVRTSDHRSNADTADNGANAAFLQLQEGDQVYVRMTANSHVWAAENSTSFSGFMVC